MIGAVDYAKVAKKAASSKAENHLCVHLDYKTYILLPPDAAKKYLDAMTQAEVLEGYSMEDYKVRPWERESHSISWMAAKDVIRIKMAQLLDIKPSEIPEKELP